MKRGRAGTFRVSFCNEGLAVFLYDDRNAEAIRTANPSILVGFSETDAADPRLAELAREGMLVVFELEQDDDVEVEVSVRSPTAKARRGGDWLPAQRARLALPSGTLCIEGYNNLRLGVRDGSDTDSPTAVEVPPGDYVLSLHRRRLEQEPEGRAERANARSPRHRIVLTDAHRAEPVEHMVAAEHEGRWMRATAAVGPVIAAP